LSFCAILISDSIITTKPYAMKVSCIIPVYNEAERVGAVLDAVVGHPLVDDIVVINDASTDRSLEVLKGRQGFRLISFDKNRGKSYSVMTGFGQCKNDLVLTLDSDLVGLTPEAIAALIEPVVSGQADMTFSLRKNSLPIFKLLGIDFVSGERVFSRRLLKDPSHLATLPGFGLESYLNQLAIEQSLRIKIVWWPNVISPRKAKKFGWWKGTKGDFRMVMQILSMLKISGVVSQILKLRTLRVK
jgi:glycosyltransferase involved in cell wall biosynthesis